MHAPPPWVHCWTEFKYHEVGRVYKNYIGGLVEDPNIVEEVE